jgi:hypothetical protein
MNGRIPDIDLAPLFAKAGIHHHETQHKPHILVIGTQECQRSIERSLVFSSKEEWEKKLTKTIGDGYSMVASETLAAIHLAVFISKSAKDLLKSTFLIITSMKPTDD